MPSVALAVPLVLENARWSPHKSVPLDRPISILVENKQGLFALGEIPSH